MTLEIRTIRIDGPEDGEENAEFQVAPFKSALHLEKHVLPQQSSLTTNVCERESKQIN